MNNPWLNIPASDYEGHMSLPDVAQLSLSLAGFFVFYTVLLVIELFLMIKYVRLGPSSLQTGRYYFEKKGASHV